MSATAVREAELYRMVMPEHTCPWGLKALDLLKREGFEVEDHHLTSREETEILTARHQVEITPQMFWLNMILGLAVMYLVMLTMIDGLGDDRNNLNMFFIAITMWAPMGICDCPLNLKNRVSMVSTGYAST